jgi:hypothetical protein
MGIVAILFPQIYGKAEHIDSARRSAAQPVAPHGSFLPRVKWAQKGRLRCAARRKVVQGHR